MRQFRPYTIFKGKIAHATYHHNHHPSTTDQSATRHSWRFLPKRDNNPGNHFRVC